MADMISKYRKFNKLSNYSGGTFVAVLIFLFATKYYDLIDYSIFIAQWLVGPAVLLPMMMFMFFGGEASQLRRKIIKNLGGNAEEHY